MQQQVSKPQQELAYLPLETYKARYTELMSAEDGWTMRAFADSFALKRFEPADSTHATVIQSGRVLDTVNRPLWALEQVKQVLTAYPAGKVYLEDFFHPGVEAFPYSGRDYKLYSFCWAQSFDRYDFTRQMPWMRSYESLMLSVARKTFVASPLLQELILAAFPQLTDQEVPFVGLPFDSKAVRAICDPAMQPEAVDVVFASRFDTEKNPMFFLDIVESMPSVKFAICTGHEKLKGNDFKALARVAHITSKPSNLTVYENLTKPEYYSILKASKVQFNCSSQDWVSFTLLEALTHGCVPCYPRYRDFNCTFQNHPEYLYTAFAHEKACELIEILLESSKSAHADMVQSILGFHDSTYSRISEHILNDN